MLTHGFNLRADTALRAMLATLLVALMAIVISAPALAQQQAQQQQEQQQDQQQDDGDSARVGVKAGDQSFELEIREGEEEGGAAAAASGSGPWYTTPLGLGILGLVAFLIIVVAVMAIRGSGSSPPSTTIVRE